MRIRYLACSLALLLAGCRASQQPVQTHAYSGPQWTQFRLNPQHHATLPGDLSVSWRLETHKAYSSSPAIVGSTLYIDNNGGDLYAIDVRTGRVQWRFHTNEALMSNPLVWQGLVIVGEGNENRFTLGSPNNALMAVDRQTGKLKWRIKLSGSGMPTPAIINGTLVQHNSGKDLLIVDPVTGVTRARIDMLSAAAMSAIVPLGGDDFATAGELANAVQRRRAQDGSLVWAAVFSKAWGMSDCPPASDGRSIFCNYTAPPPGVREDWFANAPAVEHAYAIDVANGRFRWDVTLEKGRVPIRNQAAIPLVFDNAVFFGSSIAPWMHAQDAATGALRWHLRVRGPVKGGVAAKDDAVYFGDLKGYLWAVDVKSGRVIGAKNMHTSFNVGSPVIDGKTLIVGSKTGSVIAIPLDAIRSSHDA